MAFDLPTIAGGIGSIGVGAARQAEQIQARYQLKTRRSSALHQAAQAARPALSFALPLPEVRAEVAIPEPSALHTGTNESPNAAPGAGSAPPDIGAVADRVYELMRAEILQARQRGGTRR